MEARLENGGSIGKWRLDWKMEARLKNGGSIGKSRLDCVIEPRLSQSGKTRYRGRFRSRVFGLVYQKPLVIPKVFWEPRHLGQTDWFLGQGSP